jgi:hypothetical protein
MIKPVYEEGKGYVCMLSGKAITLLEVNAERVIWSRREEYDRLFEEEEEEDIDDYLPDDGGEYC